MQLNKISTAFSLLMLLGAVGCSSKMVIREAEPNSRMGFFDRDDSMELPHRSKHSSRDSQDESHGDSQENVSSFIPSRQGDFQWPLKAVQVTSPFGKRGGRTHEGVDLRASSGTPVFAAKSGVVIYANSHIKGFGKMVVIRHERGVATIYAHNSKLLVSSGEKVKQGQEISLSGNTGHSTGPHLHFEIRRGLAAVNPVGLLPRLSHIQKTARSSRSPGVRLATAK